MSIARYEPDFSKATDRRADELFREYQQRIFVRTDRMFAVLLLFQWVAGIVTAIWISPKAWDITHSYAHPHIWAAIVLLGIINSLPVALAQYHPGRALTRHTIAIAQMLTSSVLIHLSGGRIETHFHIFGSLAFLAIYRDWRVLITATVVVTADHYLRGLYWPQSMFGVLSVSWWRWLEHVGWVIFEDVILIRYCLNGTTELREIADQTAQSEATNLAIEQKVIERTAKLRTSELELQRAKEVAESANRAKQEQVEELEQLYRLAPVGLSLMDKDHRTIRMNEKLAEINGIPIEATIGRTISEYLPGLAPRIEAIVEQVFDSGEPILDMEIQGCMPSELSTERSWLVSYYPVNSADGITQFVGCVIQEITDLKKVENDLRRQKDLLQSIIDHIPCAVFWKDRHSVCLGANQLAATDLGFASPSDMIGKSNFDLPISREEAQSFTRFDRQVMQSGEPLVNLEESLTLPDGKRLEVLTSKVPLRSDTGKVFGLLAVYLDITERKRAEDVLRNTEDRMRKQLSALVTLTRSGSQWSVGGGVHLEAITEMSATILGAPRVSVWRYNSDRSELRCIDLYESGVDKHSACGELTATDYPTYFQGLANFEVVDAVDAHADPRTRELAERYLKPLGIRSLLDAPIIVAGKIEGVISFEYFNLTKDWAADEKTFVVAVASLVALVYEVEERNRIEADLREKTAFLQAQTESSIDGLLVVDEHQKKVFQNRLFTDIWQIPQHITDLPEVDATLKYVATLLKEDSEGFIERVQYLYSHRDETARDVFELKDGRFLDRFSAPVNGSDGHYYGRFWTFRDVTLQKRAEEELQKAVDAAEAANRAKSTFLANMSHEIRTPMTAIMGYAEMLLEPDLTMPERQDALQVIRRSARHLLELVSDILDISKIEAERMTLERIATDVPQIAADVVSVLRPSAEAKGLRFVLTFGRAVPHIIQSDPVRVRQVLMNLMGNAVKFTERGEVSLHVSSIVNDARCMAVFDVTDTGIGMNDEQVQRIFKPFIQADDSTTRQFGGSGLGLTISRRLATLLGGKVMVSSVLGIGSVFRFTVDGGAPEGVEMLNGFSESLLVAAPVLVSNQVITLRGRILLAEDGPDNQKLISNHLRRAGAEVVVAENGRIAVGLARKQSFDLILMDMQMPELDGYAATRELRRNGCKLPIIALTAHAMAKDRDRCIAAGCSDYLTKPIEKNTLLSALANYLEGSELNDGDPISSSTSSREQPTAGSVLRSSFAEEPDMKEAIEQFVAALPRRMARLEELLSEKNFSELRRAVHQLKGAGGGYGYDSITQLATEVEHVLEQEDPLETIQAEVNSLIALARSIEGYRHNCEAIHG